MLDIAEAFEVGAERAGWAVELPQSGRSNDAAALKPITKDRPSDEQSLNSTCLPLPCNRF